MKSPYSAASTRLPLLSAPPVRIDDRDAHHQSHQWSQPHPVESQDNQERYEARESIAYQCFKCAGRKPNIHRLKKYVTTPTTISTLNHTMRLRVFSATHVDVSPAHKYSTTAMTKLAITMRMNNARQPSNG